MERGQIGGLNYRMTFPPRQGGYAGGMGTDDGGEEINYQQPALPKNPIAHREKLTSDYFNNYNLLKSFTLDLAKKGIDASDPYQDPEAFKVFQKLQAGLMLAANALEREGQAEDQMRPYIAQDKVRVSQNADRNGLYAQDPTSYYSTELTPGAQEVNYRLRQETNDPQSEARLNQLMQFEGQKIDQQVSRGEISPERGQYLKSQLVPNKWRTQVFSPNSGRGAGGDGKYDYQVALLRKYTNLKNGVWSPETYQKTTVNGKVFLKNEDGKGDVLGKYNARPDKNGNPILKDKVVDSWLKDPITGKVYIKYTDPEIPMEEVSNQPGDAVTRSFVSNNSKYGSVDKIMEAATATGLINEQGSSIDQMLMPQNYQDIQSQVRQAGASSVPLSVNSSAR